MSFSLYHVSQEYNLYRNTVGFLLSIYGFSIDCNGENCEHNVLNADLDAWAGIFRL